MEEGKIWGRGVALPPSLLLHVSKLPPFGFLWRLQYKGMIDKIIGRW